MKRITALLTIVLTLSLTACSHIKQIGKIGDTKLYKVQGTSLLGPSVVTLAAEKNGQVEFMSPFGGNGILPGLVGGASQVGASAIFGHSLRPDTTTVNQDSTGGAVAVGVNQTQHAEHNSSHVVNTPAPSPVPKPKPHKHKMNHHDD